LKARLTAGVTRLEARLTAGVTRLEARLTARGDAPRGAVNVVPKERATLGVKEPGASIDPGQCAAGLKALGAGGKPKMAAAATLQMEILDENPFAGLASLPSAPCATRSESDPAFEKCTAGRAAASAFRMQPITWSAGGALPAVAGKSLAGGTGDAGNSGDDPGRKDTPASRVVEAKEAKEPGAAGFAPSGCERRPTMFLVDWDDTLCASSEWHRQNGRSDSGGPVHREDMDDADQRHWKALGCWAKLLLIQMLMHSPKGVYVVTNSKEGWVEYTLRHLLPEVEPLLPQLHIISARSAFATRAEDLATDRGEHAEATFVRWKVRAMTRAVLAFCDEAGLRGETPVTASDSGTALESSPGAWPAAPWAAEPGQPAAPAGGSPVGGGGGGWPEVVALGDSAVDLKAVDQTILELGLPSVKSVKLLERPSLATLFAELQYLSSLLPALLWTDRSFHVDLDRAAFSRPAAATRAPAP
jgi:hypothetical protein